MNYETVPVTLRRQLRFSASKQCQHLAICKNFDKKLRINLLSKDKHKTSESFSWHKTQAIVPSVIALGRILHFWVLNIYLAKYFGINISACRRLG